MFKARDAKAWQREFPVGSPVTVCAPNVLLIDVFLDIVARTENRCAIKATRVFVGVLIRSIFRWKNCTRARAMFPAKNQTN